MKMIGNVSDWLSYAGGALIKVADSAGSTVGAYQTFNVTRVELIRIRHIPETRRALSMLHA